MASQNKIKCSECKAEKGTTSVRLKKLIKKYGGKRKLNAQYVCRDCKKAKAAKAPKVSTMGKIPGNKIKCTKCGTLKGSTPARIKDLKKKGLYDIYTCRDCKKSTTVATGKLPTSKVICSKCNNKFGTTKVRMTKLIGQFGTLENVHANYVCRSCRKTLGLSRNGKAKPVKNKRRKSSLKKDDNGHFVLPSSMTGAWTKKKPVPMSPEEAETIAVCWLPTIWASNKGFCNGPKRKCPYCVTGCGSKKKFFKPKKVKKAKKAKKAKKKNKK